MIIRSKIQSQNFDLCVSRKSVLNGNYDILSIQNSHECSNQGGNGSLRELVILGHKCQHAAGAMVISGHECHAGPSLASD